MQRRLQILMSAWPGTVVDSFSKPNSSSKTYKHIELVSSVPYPLTLSIPWIQHCVGPPLRSATVGHLVVNNFRVVLFLIHPFQLNHVDSFKETLALSLRTAVTLRT
jgi:hypothetical protein